MKKRVLCILLSLLFILTAFPALSASVGAEADPMITVWEKGRENTYNRLQAEGYLYKLGLRVDVVEKDKEYNIYMENYNGGSFYVQTPSEDWRVYVFVTGGNRIDVKPMTPANGRYIAVGTNAQSLHIQNLQDTSATLMIAAELGTDASPVDLSAGLYAFYAKAVYCYAFHAPDRLMISANFRLTLTRPTAREVYPFSQEAYLTNVTFSYLLASNCDHYLPTGKIYLKGATNFTSYYAVGGLVQGSAGAFRYLVFDNSFSGTARFVTRNGKHIFTKAGAEIGGASLGWMVTETIGDDEYCWYQAREHNDIRPRLAEERIRSGLPEKIIAGKKLPAELHDFYFDAKLTWFDQDDKDVTGNTAQYDKTYRAVVTVIPNGRLFVPPFDASVLRPAGAANVVTRNDTTFTVYYNADKHPDTEFTKQPVDVICDQVNRAGVFSVDTNDQSVTYQWQQSGNRADWTNLTGKTDKTLTYTISSSTSVQRMYLRCVVQGWKNGAHATLYSYIVKIEKSQNIAHLVVGGIPQQPRAYGEASQTEGSLYFYRTQSDSSTLRKDQFTLNAFWYEGAKGAVSPAEFNGIMREGATYTFRIEIAPKSGGLYSFNPAISFEQYSSGKPADKVQVKNGTWIVDFEFSNLGQVHDKIELFGFVPPYQGMGMIYPRVGNSSHYILEKAFSKGWLNEKGVSGNPAVGNVYHVELCLSLMGTPDAFNRAGDKPSVSFNQIRDRDGNLLTNYTEVKSPEYAFGKFADGSPNDKILYVTLYFKCKEKRMYRGGSVDVLQPPKAGQPLNAEYTDKTNFAGTRLEYRVNGELVTDPGSVAPKPGDVVEYILLARLLSDVKMDPGANIVLIRAGDDENSVRCHLDPTYPTDEGWYAFRFSELLECSHAETVTVRENEVKPTCTAGGSYEEVVRCKLCSEELRRETVPLQPAGHTPGAPERVNEILATCVNYGYYESVVRCAVCGEELSRDPVTVPPTGHIPGAAERMNETPATCMNVGSYDEVVSCTVCKTELSRETKTVPMTAHTPGAPVRVNEYPATCIDQGSYEEVVSCTYCGTELSRKTVATPLKAHEPGAPERENYVPADGNTPESWDEVVRCVFCGKELSRVHYAGGKPAVKLGDVNNDGKITSADARLALRRAVDLEDFAPGSRAFIACDVDKSNTVTAADARLILRAAVELEDPTKW